MSDVNFIGKEGVQNRTSRSSSPIISNENKIVADLEIDTKKSISNSKNNFSIPVFVILIVILFFIFSIQVYNYNVKYEPENISIVYILKMVSQYEDIKLQTIKSDNEKVKIIINCSKNTFYDLMNLLSELNYNVKGKPNLKETYNLFIQSFYPIFLSLKET